MAKSATKETSKSYDSECSSRRLWHRGCKEPLLGAAIRVKTHDVVAGDAKSLSFSCSRNAQRGVAAPIVKESIGSAAIYVVPNDIVARDPISFSES